VKVFLRVLENTDVSDELKMKALTKTMQALAVRMSQSVPPVEFANEMFSILRNVTQVDDPFRSIKKKSNEAALSLLPKATMLMKEKNGIDGLRLASLLSIAGNVIDVSTGNHSFSLSDLWSEIEKTVAAGLDIDDSPSFMTLVRKEASVFFLGDNAGEIVLDIPLIRFLRKEGVKVNYVVRGGAIANDATIEDAIQVDLGKEVDNLGSTGQRAFGIRLDALPKATMRLYNDSDLLLSKGQSNYEALNWSETKKPIYFLLKVKCIPIGRTLGLAIGSNAFLRKKEQTDA